MAKTLARCERLVELRLQSRVYGDDLGHHSGKKIHPYEHSAAFPLSAEHLLETTASMQGLKLLRCDLASGSLHDAKGLTERIAREHPKPEELRFGFGVHQPDEVLLAFLPRHQSMRRLLVREVHAANRGGEHGADHISYLEGLDRAADAFKALFPQLEVLGTEEDPFEKVY
ncbi:hypothetical protein LX32DRAFT_698838 [Colletotrichum zoysiae]|uniref:Uncharacterized protein n=1 Tax=Colletotrichum zoysiae TaxID=1216348 RepID=A0AAD9LXY9_9PEZI|nr:hypothetical protein LX32DRAFT_698838 [Colletotrichum zoysiae]